MKLEPARLVLGVVMIAVGVLHFTHTQVFASIVPDYLPAHEALVLISGVFEIGLGVGLLLERTRVLAAWGLVALYVAVFPANLNMALHPERPIAGVPSDFHISTPALWLRLPLQLALIYWALRYTKRPEATPATS
jgi:uncharacterized membrane protein